MRARMVPWLWLMVVGVMSVAVALAAHLVSDLQAEEQARTDGEVGVFLEVGGELVAVHGVLLICEVLRPDEMWMCRVVQE